MPYSGQQIPLSQRTATELRAQSYELREMAQSASTEDVKVVLLELAARFEELAAKVEEQRQR